MAKPKTSTFIRRAIAAASILLSGAATAATMATQPWVTNKIAEAIAALPPASADLTAATNYTDTATNALAGSVRSWIAVADAWTQVSPPVPWSGSLAYEVAVPEGGVLDFAGTWPVGASALVRIDAPASYTLGPAVRLLGYAPLPASRTWYAAVWFNGSRYLINPVYAEGQQ